MHIDRAGDGDPAGKLRSDRYPVESALDTNRVERRLVVYMMVSMARVGMTRFC